MGKKRKPDPGVDELLDEILEIPAAEVEFDDGNDDITEPPEPESSAPPGEEAEGEEDSSSDETDSSLSDSEPSADLEDETETEDEDEEDQGEDDVAAKRADAFKRDLIKQRKRNAELQAQAQQMQLPYQPPVAPPPAETTAPTNTPPGLPVLVSEDGSQVYVDPMAFEAAVQKQARELIRQAQTPTPEQIAAQEHHQQTEAIRTEYPETYSEAEQADAYLTESLAGLQAEGWKPRSIADVKQLFREQGVEKQLTEHLPQLTGPLFGEFIDAWTSGQPAWKRSVVERMAAGTAPPSEMPARRRPDLSPKSLARKGGSRTTANGTTDLREFKQLEAEFSKESWSFPDDKYDRLKELGKKLNQEGY